jgi:hypothetical protein
MPQRFHIDQATDMRGIAVRCAVVQELVLERLAAPAAMHEQVFKLDQAREMDLQLCITPAGVLAQPTAAKAVLRAADLLLGARPLDHLDE